MVRSLILGLLISAACFAQEPTAHAPVRVSRGVMARNLLTKITPVFPEEAKRRRVSGGVVLDAIIDTNGRIEDLRVVSGPPMLRKGYLNAVKHWVYKPYSLNGVPVVVETTIVIQPQMGAAYPASTDRR